MTTCRSDILLESVSLLEFNVPILGICFGYQTLSMAYGGNVTSMKKMVDTRKKVQLKKSKIFKGLKKEEKFKFMHGDYVDEVPKSFKVIGKTSNGMVQAIQHRNKPIYGVQFHPEISGKSGEVLLDNFLNLCGL